MTTIIHKQIYPIEYFDDVYGMHSKFYYHHDMNNDKKIRIQMTLYYHKKLIKKGIIQSDFPLKRVYKILREYIKKTSANWYDIYYYKKYIYEMFEKIVKKKSDN
jgi:hypothetical protein